MTIVNQPFDMNLFLQRKVDAAAAMTYNELAQVLETKNPKTGQLYKLSDLNVFKMASPAVGTGMLEDNIFTTEKYLKTPSNKTTIVNFLKASMQGWIYCRDHVQECTNIVLKNGTALGHGHQLWQMNEINKLVWPNSVRHRSRLEEAARQHGEHRQDVRRDEEAAAGRGHVLARRPGAEPAEAGRRRHLRQQLQADHGQGDRGRQVGREHSARRACGRAGPHHTERKD